MTLMFCDVVGSTEQAARRKAQRLYRETGASLHVERLGRELGT